MRKVDKTRELIEQSVAKVLAGPNPPKITSERGESVVWNKVEKRWVCKDEKNPTADPLECVLLDLQPKFIATEFKTEIYAKALGTHPVDMMDFIFGWIEPQANSGLAYTSMAIDLYRKYVK